DLSRAAAHLPDDPGIAEGGVRAPRQPAPQHLRRCPVAAHAVAPGGAPPAAPAGWADRRGRGLRRVRRDRAARGAECRAPPAGTEPTDPAAHYGAGLLAPRHHPARDTSV